MVFNLQIRLFKTNFAFGYRVYFTALTSIHFEKGVIEILSSKVELGGLQCNEDKVGNSTCIDCLYPATTGSIYSKIGVGLLFYLLHRYAKT